MLTAGIILIASLYFLVIISVVVRYCVLDKDADVGDKTNSQSVDESLLPPQPTQILQDDKHENILFKFAHWCQSLYHFSPQELELRRVKNRYSELNEKVEEYINTFNQRMTFLLSDFESNRCEIDKLQKSYPPEGHRGIAYSTKGKGNQHTESNISSDTLRMNTLFTNVLDLQARVNEMHDSSPKIKPENISSMNVSDWETSYKLLDKYFCDFCATTNSFLIALNKYNEYINNQINKDSRAYVNNRL